MATRLPTEQDVADKLAFLAESDSDWAIACSYNKAAEERLKVVRARCFLESEGKNIAEREAKALTSPEYAKAIESVENSLAEKLRLGAERQRAQLVIEVWRSLNANQRRTAENAL